MNENSVFIDLFNKDHRKIWYRKQNNFHLRLSDMDEIKEKDLLKEQKNKTYHKNLIQDCPLISERSRRLSLNKITLLESDYQF